MKKEVVCLSQSSRMRIEILKIESRQNSCCIGEEERGEACLHSSPFSAAAFPSPNPPPPSSPSIGLPAGLAASAVSLFNPSVCPQTAWNLFFTPLLLYGFGHLLKSSLSPAPPPSISPS